MEKSGSNSAENALRLGFEVVGAAEELFADVLVRKIFFIEFEFVERVADACVNNINLSSLRDGFKRILINFFAL